MKIICEHCGTSIDLDKDKVCPNCKAPFSKNQDYNEYKENIKKERDINIKSKELDNEIKEKAERIHPNALKAKNKISEIENKQSSNSQCVGSYSVSGYTRSDGTKVRDYTRTCGAKHNN